MSVPSFRWPNGRVRESVSIQSAGATMESSSERSAEFLSFHRTEERLAYSPQSIPPASNHSDLEQCRYREATRCSSPRAGRLRIRGTLALRRCRVEGRRTPAFLACGFSELRQVIFCMRLTKV